MRNKRFRLIVAIFVIFYLAGCTTSKDSTRYYLLSPISLTDLPNQHLKQSEKKQTISLRLNRFPAYLNRPQIVTHHSANRLELAEYDRWAEPLKDNFSRVLTQDIGRLLPGHKILQLPQRLTPLAVDYQIELDIIRFDIDEFNKGRLIAQWTIRQPNNSGAFIAKVSDITITVENSGYDNKVSTLNTAIFQLSEKMTQALQWINDSSTLNETSQ